MIDLRKSLMVGVATFGMLAAGSATAIAAPSMAIAAPSAPSVVHCAPGDVLQRNVCQAPPHAGWWWDGAHTRWAPPSPHAGWSWDGAHDRWNPPSTHH
jgi:hypothetical protein